MTMGVPSGMAGMSLQCGNNLAPRHVKSVSVNKYLHDSVYINILEPGSIVVSPLKISSLHVSPLV